MGLGFESVARKVAERMALANAARAQFLGSAFAVTFILAGIGDALGMGTLRRHGYMLGQLLAALAVVAAVRWSRLGRHHAGAVFAIGMSLVSAFGAAHLSQFGGLDGPYFYGSYTAPPILIPMLMPLRQRVAGTIGTVGAFVLVYWLCLPTLFAHPMAHIPITYLLTISGIAISLGHYVYRLERESLANLATLEAAAEVLERQLEEGASRPTQLRREIARQLHDDVAQLITGARIHLDGWALRHAKDDIATRLAQLLDELAHRAHRMLHELREPPPRGALEDELERLKRDYAGLGLSVDLLIEEDAKATPIGIAHVEVLIATTREALTNAVRHGGSSEATVSVHLDALELSLEIFDNGGGRVAEVREGYGLLGIRERVAGLGGVAELSDYEEGLRLSIRLPRVEAA